VLTPLFNYFFAHAAGEDLGRELAPP
jgi:hypothetical protein